MQLRSLVACAVLLAAPTASLADVSEAGPTHIVERLQSALLGAMRGAAKTPRAERSAALDVVVRDAYDLEFMARTSLGASWKLLDDAQRRRWVDALGSMISATLVDGFGSYSGEAFEVLGERPAALGTTVVATRMTAPHEDAIAFDYRMRRDGERWRVIDVYVDGGASELALRRSEYSATVARKGFDGLLDEVERKTRTLLAVEGK